VPRSPRPKITAAELDELIEQATVDCYNDSEQVTGLFTLLEEHLETPFHTTVLGVSVTVTGVDVTTSDQIIAICQRDRHRQDDPDPRPGAPQPRTQGLGMDPGIPPLARLAPGPDTRGASALSQPAARQRQHLGRRHAAGSDNAEIRITRYADIRIERDHWFSSWCASRCRGSDRNRR